MTDNTTDAPTDAAESPQNDRHDEFEYCEFCESDPRTTDRESPHLAAFWVKCMGGYGQACDECTDELVEYAPNNTIVVHGAPGEYNFETLTEAGHRISDENQARYRDQLPESVIAEVKYQDETA